MEAGGIRTKEGILVAYPYRVPIYEANVEKLGLLGSSAAGDVARVFSAASIISPSQQDKIDADIKMWIAIDEGMIESINEWMENISHVVKRLVALEHGFTDPGTLYELEQQRQQRKPGAADEKS